MGRHNLTRTLSVTLCLGLLLISFAGCTPQKQKTITDTGFYLDTIISITLYDAAQAPYINDCFSLAEKYEGYFSDTIADSDISDINAHPFSPVKVHDETLSLIKEGIRYGRLSDGRFDITVGKLSALWDFTDDAGDGFNIPDEKEIAALAAGISYENITVDEVASTVTLNSDISAIDLGGIAKGYIADQMKTYLSGQGVEAGLINLGGNVLCIQDKPDGSAYTIGIQKPFAADGEAILTLDVTDRSVVTSGTYQRYFEADGNLYHHILDTATGYPYDNGLSSVTVITASSTDGDALSTTLFAMGLEDGLRFAKDLDDCEAVFITTDEKPHYTSGFLDGTISYEEVP